MLSLKRAKGQFVTKRFKDGEGKCTTWRTQEWKRRDCVTRSSYEWEGSDYVRRRRWDWGERWRKTGHLFSWRAGGVEGIVSDVTSWSSVYYQYYSVGAIESTSLGSHWSDYFGLFQSSRAWRVPGFNASVGTKHQAERWKSVVIKSSYSGEGREACRIGEQVRPTLVLTVNIIWQVYNRI